MVWIDRFTHYRIILLVIIAANKHKHNVKQATRVGFDLRWLPLIQSEQLRTFHWEKPFDQKLSQTRRSSSMNRFLLGSLLEIYFFRIASGADWLRGANYVNRLQ